MKTDILSIAERYTTLKRKTETEYAGACPLCGGTDRFVVFADDKPGWLCRGCSPEHRKSAIDLVMAKEGMSYPEACQHLGEPLPEKTNRPLGDTWAVKVDGQWVHFPINTTYDYVDSAGELLFQVVRYTKDGKSKNFGQRHPDPTRKSGWRQGTRGCVFVPYALPALRRAAKAGEVVYVVEGEKAAAHVASCGFTATTNVGGAGMGKRVYTTEYCEWFRGARVVVVADNDAQGQGQAHARMIAERLTGIAASVDVRLSGRWEEATGQGLDDWLRSGGSVEDLPGLDPLPATAHGDDDRMEVDYNNKNLPHLHQACWGAIQERYRGELYQQHGTLLRINGNISTVDHIGMVNLLAYAVRLMEDKPKQGKKENYPDPTLTKTMLRLLPEDIPEVERIVSLPALVRDGDGYRVIEAHGYDRQARIFHQQTVGLPGEMSVDQARALILDELLCDFPFDSEASRANAVALLLLPFVRSLIHGATPLHLIEAARAGTGKGLLATVAALIWTGKPAALTSAPARGDDSEWGKILTAALRQAPAYLMLDNVTNLRSDALAMALTAQVWEGRLLGQSDMLCLRNDAVWMATGNNVTLAGDMPRRIVPIRMVATQEDPSLRTGFKHPDLPEWVLANRGALVRACLTLAKHGLASGVASNAPRIGSFEGYSDVLGRILAGCGIAGFLGNLTRVRENPQIEAWRAVVEIWHERHGENPIKPSELWATIRGDDCPLELRGETPRAQTQSLGHMLRKQDGAVFAISNGFSYQIVQVGRVKEKAYALRECYGNASGTPGMVSSNVPGGNDPLQGQRRESLGMSENIEHTHVDMYTHTRAHAHAHASSREKNIPGIPDLPDIPGCPETPQGPASEKNEDGVPLSEQAYRIALLERLVTADMEREELDQIHRRSTRDLAATVFYGLVRAGDVAAARKLADQSSDPQAMHASVDWLIKMSDLASPH